MLEAAALLAATRFILLASPRRLTAGLLRRASDASGEVSSENTRRASDVARDVDRIAPLIGASCLSRALTSWLMLRRRGVAASVRVGARRGEGDTAVHMHAWLEVAGTPVNPDERANGFATLKHR